MNNKKLVLENKMVFEGTGFGSNNEAVAYLTFNTQVVGYQETISDPTNAGKIICMTYPLIGNYGLNDEDYESKSIKTKGIVVREYNDLPSNFRFTRTLNDVMEENNIVGISNVDTRKLMQVIRSNSLMKGLICDIDKPLEECLEILNHYEEEKLTSFVSSKKIWYSRTHNPKYNIGVVDLGIKRSFIKELNKNGCNVIVFPYNVTKEELLKYKLDGLFVSNGPGNPNDLEEVEKTIKSLIGVLPIFGVALGAMLIAKAEGANVQVKEKANNGGNYPVKNVTTSKVEITSINTIYSLENLENTDFKITHENVINKEVLGIKNIDKKIMGIMFYPAVLIDEDSENMYLEFINLIKDLGGNNNA